MQWRVRQHYSEFTVVRGNAGEINFRRRNHNWSCNRHEQTRSFFRKLDQTADYVDVPRDEGKRFFLSVLAFAQRRHHHGIHGVARQVVSTEPLYREDASLAEQLRRFADASFASTVITIVGV